MSRTMRFLAGGTAIVALVVMSVTRADAALIVDGSLTLDTDPATFYQQTAASPCVIGGENCLNGGFDYTVAGSGGGGSLFDYTSPLYAVSDITTLVGGNAFTIGLDYNQSGTSPPQDLQYFEATYYNGVTTSQIFDIATVLQTNNNGVGFSDFLLSGFVIPEGTLQVQFQAIWWNNDGPDRFFLIGAEPVVCTPGDADCPTDVAEPTTMALFGLGLLGAGIARRRRK